ncbi:hypothetical protein GWI33_023171 [Rhynchophorus ferrugineus]|uniref:Uncharacterized protein n=1 Tax=Rhynchophorus ferrugineus TaxID=354439 RepID=A0A834LZ33_RHYFE|nr:hypothetical protein GWI33_023171 [Rhynchophorus ferrugineus]
MVCKLCPHTQYSTLLRRQTSDRVTIFCNGVAFYQSFSDKDTMEKEEPVAYMTWVYLGILMTFIKYYSATASRIVYRISNLAKVVASKLVSNKFSQEGTMRTKDQLI